MTRVLAIVETAVYVDDLPRAAEFYGGVLGLEEIGRDDERHLFYRVADRMLLVFRSAETIMGDGFPPHGAVGPGHFALGIDASELDGWRVRLAARGVPIEHEVAWPRGGRSLYFRDPAGNSVELLTPGVWRDPPAW
jgi:catechol 2,3-dioxygenase-like lactoylglutathione lyase family enzyme